jgi:hypothetical protein
VPNSATYLQYELGQSPLTSVTQPFKFFFLFRKKISRCKTIRIASIAMTIFNSLHQAHLQIYCEFGVVPPELILPS